MRLRFFDLDKVIYLDIHRDGPFTCHTCLIETCMVGLTNEINSPLGTRQAIFRSFVFNILINVVLSHFLYNIIVQYNTVTYHILLFDIVSYNFIHNHHIF